MEETIIELMVMIGSALVGTVVSDMVRAIVDRSLGMLPRPIEWGLNGRIAIVVGGTLTVLYEVCKIVNLWCQ